MDKLQLIAQIQASNPLFVVPSFYNAARSIIAPQYQEWNLAFEQGFGRATTLTLNYVGNHGIHETVQNPGLNAFGFGNLPAGPIDPRFGRKLVCGAPWGDRMLRRRDVSSTIYGLTKDRP
jgi:hypothetical protein